MLIDECQFFFIVEKMFLHLGFNGCLILLDSPLLFVYIKDWKLDIAKSVDTVICLQLSLAMILFTVFSHKVRNIHVKAIFLLLG